MTRFGTYENMIVLHVSSDWSHISRRDNPVSLRLIVDFNMSNSKTKHSQSVNAIVALLTNNTGFGPDNLKKKNFNI